MKRIKYGRDRCRMCGEMVTRNALGRAAHERACKGRQARLVKPTLESWRREQISGHDLQFVPAPGGMDALHFRDDVLVVVREWRDER